MSYNTNPNGYDGGDVAGFLDPSPWLEGCDRMNCTAIVGGDHVPTCEVSRRIPVAYVSYGPCHICGRDCDETSVNVAWPDGSVGPVCSRCWEKADEGPDIPVDYMAEDDDA